MRRFMRKWIIDNTMLKRTAIQKPLTSKPLTSDEAKRIISPLITNVKRPSVRILMGRVMRMRKGLRRRFTIPRNKATHKAEKKLLTVTPGIK
jgi:hypothetical protein